MKNPFHGQSAPQGQPVQRPPQVPVGPAPGSGYPPPPVVPVYYQPVPVQAPVPVYRALKPPVKYEVKQLYSGHKARKMIADGWELISTTGGNFGAATCYTLRRPK